ncbi:cupredoxin domain-containing protein [Haloplanus salilacus]|uniref:cupredoxin domain-containing protein n=1 Tax=Haloplanus salilacus TaxID=2949994 RepID=UPI0030D49833
MRRRRVLATLGAGLAATSAGCAAAGSGGTTQGDVGMTSEAFEPATITVRVGDEVVWYNNSARAHSVTAYEDAIPEGADYWATGGYDSEDAAREAWKGLNGALESGETYSHRFEVPGEYGYFCIPHERAGMVGTVVVEE